MPVLSHPTFHDEDAARAHLEATRWPDGPRCPHCGATNVHRMAGRTQAGMFQCRACRKKFSVTVGTLYERSHVPLHKWLLATHLLCASKKGMSAHQLHRMLGVTYKTAWFMAHRIREAMREPLPEGGLGGPNAVVEADETFVGGKAKNRARRKAPPKKEAVVSLVEREGDGCAGATRVRSFHVPEVTAKTLRPILVTQIDRKSYLMTDESGAYKAVGRESSGHGSVNRSIEQYVRGGGFFHTSVVENYFSLLKRGLIGTYHHVSQQHLKRYVGEFDFRYNHRKNHRKASDAERAAVALKGIEGKRLTHRRADASTRG